MRSTLLSCNSLMMIIVICTLLNNKNESYSPPGGISSALSLGLSNLTFLGGANDDSGAEGKLICLFYKAYYTCPLGIIPPFEEHSSMNILLL